MNYNFTDACRKVLAAARDAAVELGVDYVGTEHILLGALKDAEVVELIDRLGVRQADVRGALMQIVPTHRDRSGKRRPMDLLRQKGELPYTSRAKKVLEFSMAEAREAGDDYVGTEHLLLGLIREEKGIAAEVMEDFELTLERVRTARAGGRVEPRSRLRVAIDDASDSSIYEQIVAQITEAVATGALHPGERLPTVRQLADELDIAPGTVARAYSELERQKLVVTEGARGTRVAERQAMAPSPGDRPETLAGLLRPVVVAAFHLGGNAEELRAALEEAMRGIFDRGDRAA